MNLTLELTWPISSVTSLMHTPVHFSHHLTPVTCMPALYLKLGVFTSPEFLPIWCSCRFILPQISYILSIARVPSTYSCLFLAFWRAKHGFTYLSALMQVIEASSSKREAFRIPSGKKSPMYQQNNNLDKWLLSRTLKAISRVMRSDYWNGR